MKKQYEMPMGHILLCADADIIRTSDLLNYDKQSELPCCHALPTANGSL